MLQLEVIKPGLYLEIDGKAVAAPVGHKFEAERNTFPDKCRELEVATPAAAAKKK